MISDLISLIPINNSNCGKIFRNIYFQFILLLLQNSKFCNISFKCIVGNTHCSGDTISPDSSFERYISPDIDSISLQNQYSPLIFLLSSRFWMKFPPAESKNRFESLKFSRLFSSLLKESDIIPICSSINSIVFQQSHFIPNLGQTSISLLR